MTGLEYLKTQVKPLGFQDKISYVQFPDNEDTMICPFCGNPITIEFNAGAWVGKPCNCDKSKKEQEVVKELDILKLHIQNLQKEYDEKLTEWQEKVFGAGCHLAAKHYMEQKPQRDTFDSEIEKIANEN